MDALGECMFCGDALPEGPENLTFLEHVGQNATCDDQYESWMAHMHQDYLGG